MEPQEFFHDHPVIDEQEDGINIIFHDLPPILLNNPIIFSEEDLLNSDIWLPRLDDPPIDDWLDEESPDEE